MNIRLTAAVVGLALAAACSPPAPAVFTLSSASVDSSYWCPGGSTDAAYTVQATIRVRNDTSRSVTIDSASADMVLAAVTGSWLEKVGDRYEADKLNVNPTTVAAHSSATLKLGIPSTCTSAVYDSSNSSSGTYQVKIHLATSAGTYSITASNTHVILAA